MTRLEEEKRAALSRALREARVRKGWNQEEAAERATEALRLAVRAEDPSSEEERRLWLEIEVSRHHIATFENCPANPLATLDRRSRLLGLVLAVGVDRALVNRLAGGL